MKNVSPSSTSIGFFFVVYYLHWVISAAAVAVTVLRESQNWNFSKELLSLTAVTFFIFVLFSKNNNKKQQQQQT
ncbi:hypothetical protein DERP_005077 [Dermatophagoides pteronyssinus]|uniref:Uncharacterized protein n=1 Tax=Dermatophagoides pteronyssinus TaxID=6956 RepID=A0ABQ8JTB6_DERPT|nr:hypothetical protein DERP_005077 [Dermatophagoides pteronyssinus]